MKNQLKARYPKIYWAPYLFQDENNSAEKFVGMENYIEVWDYLFNGSNFEVSYLYHRPKDLIKTKNAYLELLKNIERKRIETKKKKDKRLYRFDRLWFKK